MLNNSFESIVHDGQVLASMYEELSGSRRLVTRRAWHLCKEVFVEKAVGETSIPRMYFFEGSGMMLRHDIEQLVREQADRTFTKLTKWEE